MNKRSCRHRYRNLFLTTSANIYIHSLFSQVKRGQIRSTSRLYHGCEVTPIHMKNIASCEKTVMKFRRYRRNMECGTTSPPIKVRVTASRSFFCLSIALFLSAGSMAQSVSSLNAGEYIRAFPNPVSSGFRMEYFLHRTKKLTLRILSMNGQLMQQLADVDNGQWMDIRSLPGGTYILQVTDADGRPMHLQRLNKTDLRMLKP